MLIYLILLTTVYGFELYLLKDVRSQLRFSESSDLQRLRSVNLSRNGFQIFVNKKKRTDKSDPIKKLDHLYKICQNMTENEFQISMYSIYKDVNDPQQEYVFPPPHSCFRVVIPIEFTRIKGGNDSLYYYAVKSKTDVYRKFGNGWLDEIQLGDILTSVDGVLIKNLALDYPELFSGNNRDAQVARWIKALTYRSLKNNLLPTRNHVTLGFTRNNVSFVQTLDYLVYSTECMLQDLKPNVNPQDHLSLYDPADSWDMNMEHQVFRHLWGEYGYISFNNFMARSEKMIPELQGLLTKEMGKTKGIVIDVRNNAGGSVELASRYF